MTTSYDVADLGRAEAGEAAIDWVAASMPMVRSIGERFAAERPLEGLRVGACMHVTPETAVLLDALASGGAQIALAASNPLSTRDDIAAALVARHGVAVHARHGVDRVGYYAHLQAVLDTEPQLVIDDACDLVDTLHTHRPALASSVRGGCEQTTTGVLRLRQMARAGVLRFPMIAVDDSPAKRLLDNRHGTGQSTLDAILRATNLLLAGRTVVVAGYGAAGRGIAERARGLSARVVVTEVDPARALEAALDGYTVLPMTEAAPLADVIITATGNRDVVRAEHLDALRDGVVLANAGHFDVEIDVGALRDAAVDIRHVRPHTDAHLLPDGRRLLLVAQGRVANLAAAEGHPPAVMDVAFATQALALAWLARAAPALDPGVHETPAEIDAEVARLALAGLGIRIDELTDDQRHYRESWEYGS